MGGLGWEGRSRGSGAHTYIADSLNSMVEMNTILQSNYTPSQKKIFLETTGEGLEQKNDISTFFIFEKDHSGFWVENGLEEQR